MGWFTVAKNPSEWRVGQDQPWAYNLSSINDCLFGNKTVHDENKFYKIRISNIAGFNLYGYVLRKMSLKAELNKLKPVIHKTCG